MADVRNVRELRAELPHHLEGSLDTYPSKVIQDLIQLQTAKAFKVKRLAGSLVDQEYKWVYGIEYRDTQNKWHNVNFFKCIESVPGAARPTTFRHVSNIVPAKQNVPKLSAVRR